MGFEGRRVLVCGGRGFDERKLLAKTLNALHEQEPIALVIAGGAPGADREATSWAERRQIHTCVYPANWRYVGCKAGPLRNLAMLAFGKPDLVVAFPGGAGTENMIRAAEATDVPVVRAGQWANHGEAA